MAMSVKLSVGAYMAPSMCICMVISYGRAFMFIMPMPGISPKASLVLRDSLPDFAPLMPIPI